MGEITRVCLWSHCVHYETASPQNSIHHLSSISPTVIGRRWWYLSAKPQRQSGAQESLKRLGTQQLQQWSQVPLVKYSINIYKTNFRPSHGALPWMLSSLMDLWKLHEKLCLFIMIIQVRLLCLLDLEYCRFGSIALLFWLEIDPLNLSFSYWLNLSTNTLSSVRSSLTTQSWAIDLNSPAPFIPPL